MLAEQPAHGRFSDTGVTSRAVTDVTAITREKENGLEYSEDR